MNRAAVDGERLGRATITPSCPAPLSFFSPLRDQLPGNGLSAFDWRPIQGGGTAVPAWGPQPTSYGKWYAAR